MSDFAQFAIFYTVAGFIIGAIVSAMDTVNLTFRGHPLPYPRLLAGLVTGLIWPFVVFKMISGK